MENLFYWVWLSSIPGIGPLKARKALNYFKDPFAIWEASLNQLIEANFFTKKNIESILDKKIRDNAKIYMEKLQKYGITVVTIDDPLYPENLKNIYDPPVVLYKKGSMKSNEKFLGVVGSRKASKYGQEMAERLSYELAEYGVTIVSGMARGIDSFAHKGALKADGRTIAVLGSGLDKVYPYENKNLMEEISRNGAVLSEYLPETLPLPNNFPARNRIISGISYGVLVIEAGEKSGSLITANFALEQGREVFALPGNIVSFNSKGTNNLIRDGAKIVTSVEDILEEFGLFNTKEIIKSSKKSFNIDKVLENLEDNEKKVVIELNSSELHIDDISKRSGLSMQYVNSIVVMLELKGVIEQLPGKIFKLIGT